MTARSKSNNMGAKRMASFILDRTRVPSPSASEGSPSLAQARTGNGALGLVGGRTRTGRLSAAGAAGAVFAPECVVKVYAGVIGQGRQPSEDVGEFESAFLGAAAAQGRRQFAHLLHEPHEGPVHAAARVLGAVNGTDQVLQLGERQRGRPSGRAAAAERGARSAAAARLNILPL